MLADAAEWITGFSVVMLAFGAAFVAPYAFRELRDNPLRLRGQFAIGFTLVCLGAALRLAVGWIVLHAPPSARGALITASNPYIIAACLLLVLGTPLVIRLVTFERYGERAWIASVAVAAAVATAVLVMT